MSVTEIRCGRYRHYKGQEYQVLGVVRHSETEELLVLYRPLYGKQELWVRPLAMFDQSVSTASGVVTRFEYIGPMADDS